MCFEDGRKLHLDTITRQCAPNTHPEHMGVTLQIYGHRSTGKVRGAAEQLGDVIRNALVRRAKSDEDG